MASSLTNIPAKDGTGTTVPGGILAVDKSGSGAGPTFQAQTLVDTQGVNTATIKAASTAPATTDTALVVAISPNNTIPVSVATIPSHAVTNAGTFAVQNNAATPAGTNVIGSVKATDGTNTAAVKAASTAAIASDPALVVAISPNNTIPVTLAAGSATVGSLKVTDGTNTATVKAASIAPVATDTALVVSISPNSLNANGQAVAASSAPVVLASDKGLLGVGHTAAPSAVSDGTVVPFITDKVGKQVVVGSIRDLKGNQFTTITSSTSETTVVTAVASTFLDVYGCIIENTSATGTKVTFKDSTAGTTRFELYVPPTDTRGFMLPESAAFAQTTVNNNWTATCGASVASIVITMLYVKNI